VPLHTDEEKHIMADFYKLDSTTIDQIVTRKSPGVYALDRTTTPGFTVNYVGRADDDVAQRLKTWASGERYKYFKFEYHSSAKAAFERECHLYHLYPNLDNSIHPARPANTNYACPVAGCRALR
jgi:hypothetical protein